MLALDAMRVGAQPRAAPRDVREHEGMHREQRPRDRRGRALVEHGSDADEAERQPEDSEPVSLAGNLQLIAIGHLASQSYNRLG